MLRPLVPLVLVLLAVPAAAAHAATVAVDAFPEDERGEVIHPDVGVIAAAGERNDVHLALAADGRVRVRDAGARLTAGTGCVQRGAHAATCAVDVTPRRVRVALGDRDDRFDLQDARTGDVGEDAGRVEVLGDAGDDELSGSANGDLLRGGAGRDVLRGRGGDDRFDVSDAIPRDASRSSTGGRLAPQRPDVVVGGTGHDVVDYSEGSGRRGIVATLRAPGGGGERGRPRRLRDRWSSVEGIVGSGSRDVLTGGPGDDELRGGVVRGGGGDDVLAGDEVDGGPGDDVLDAGRGTPAIRCGSGSDEVTGTSEQTLVPADCERVTFQEVRVSAVPVRTAAGGLALVVDCVVGLPGLPCFAGARLDLTVGAPPTAADPPGSPYGTVLARGTSVAPDASATPRRVELAPTPEGVPLLARRRGQFVRIVIDQVLPQFPIAGPAWAVELPPAG